MTQLEAARAQAVATIAAGRVAGATQSQIEAAAIEPGNLAASRANITASAATAFADIWSKTFETIPRHVPPVFG